MKKHLNDLKKVLFLILFLSNGLSAYTLKVENMPSINNLFKVDILRTPEDFVKPMEIKGLTEDILGLVKIAADVADTALNVAGQATTGIDIQGLGGKDITVPANNKAAIEAKQHQLTQLNKELEELEGKETKLNVEIENLTKKIEDK